MMLFVNQSNTSTNLSISFTFNSNHSEITDNITYAFCQSRRTIYRNLDPKARITLAVMFASAGIISILCNSIVVYSIHTTRQLHVQSITLLRNFSLLDIMASSVNFVHLKAILDPYHIECRFYYTLNFLRVWAIYSSSFMVPVTGLDRFIHVHYTVDYMRVFTPLRKNLVLALYFVCVLYLSTVSTVTMVTNGPYTALKYTMPLNVIFFLVIIFFYLKSMFVLKKHAERNETSSSRRSIIKITAVYFYFYLVSTFILLTHPFLSKWIKERTGLLDSSLLSVHRLSNSFIPTIIATSNALAFLWINKKARNLLKSLFKHNAASVASSEN